MKKIISILLLIIFVSTNFSFGFIVCNPGCNLLTQTCDTNVGQCKDINSTNTQWSAVPMDECNAAWWTYSNNTCTCPEWKIYNSDTKACVSTDCTPACTGGKLCNCTPTGCSCATPTTTTSSSTSVMGITCGPDELVNGQCKLNIYQTLGIRKTNQSTSVGLFVQDIVLSATFFIGTLVTVALIVSWLMFIFASSSGKDPQKARQGIIGSLLGLLIVVSSYVIIRLVQYIAKGF